MFVAGTYEGLRGCCGACRHRTGNPGSESILPLHENKTNFLGSYNKKDKKTGWKKSNC